MLARVRAVPLALHLLAGLVALTCATPGLRAETRVPADLQAAILTRMISYDRALQAIPERRAVVGILSKSGDRSSARAAEGLAKAIALVQAGRVPGIPLAAVTTHFTDPAGLTAWLKESKVRVLYVEAALSEDLDGVRAVCASMRIASIAPVRAFVERGLAAGIVPNGDRAAILINLPVAQAVGMDLDPKLLELAEVIR